jgi:hypothetical protein
MPSSGYAKKQGYCIFRYAIFSHPTDRRVGIYRTKPGIRKRSKTRAIDIPQHVYVK